MLQLDLCGGEERHKDGQSSIEIPIHVDFPIAFDSTFALVTFSDFITALVVDYDAFGNVVQLIGLGYDLPVGVSDYVFLACYWLRFEHMSLHSAQFEAESIKYFHSGSEIRPELLSSRHSVFVLVDKLKLPVDIRLELLDFSSGLALELELQGHTAR